MTIRLDIGSGPVPEPGHIGIDKYVTLPNIVNADMWDLPYESNEVDGIFSSHALEHIPKKHVIPTLREWHRVLKPGAVAHIRVPDLEWCVTEWLKTKCNDWNMDTIFGNQDHPGEFHLTGFTVEIMHHYLIAAGFVHVQASAIMSHRQRTLVFIATKGPAQESLDVPSEE